MDKRISFPSLPCYSAQGFSGIFYFDQDKIIYEGGIVIFYQITLFNLKNKNNPVFMSPSLWYGQDAEKTELSIKLGMVALMLKPKHLHQINDFREASYQFPLLFLDLHRILFHRTHLQRHSVTQSCVWDWNRNPECLPRKSAFVCFIQSERIYMSN